MKLHPILPLIALALAGGPVAAFTHESAKELFLDADLDGDGRQDVVIVDRDTGAFRVGYQLVAGVHTFAPARATGIQDVSSVSAGRMLALDRDTLVLSSPSANRVNLVEAATASSVVVPVSVYPPGIGATEACAIDIGGAGNTGHADLVTFTAWNNPPNPFRRGLIRWNGAAASLIGEAGFPGEWRGLQQVRLKDGGPLLMGGLERVGADHTLRIANLASGAPVAVASAAGAGPHYVYGKFTAGPLRHFLSWQMGSSNLVNHAVTENVPGVFGFAAPITYNMGRRISQVVVLESTPAHRLLCLFRDGTEAAIYTFDGAAAPVLSATIPVPAGEVFNGAVPLANGDVHLLGGAPGEASVRFLQYGQSGANYVQKASGLLPDPNPFGTAANVFLFAGEPFVSTNPRLLRSLNAADWASLVDVSGANVVVTAERRGTPAQGLGSPAVRNLGAKPAGTTHALMNQFRDGISISTFLPANGDEGGEVMVSPSPGPQTQAIEVTLTPGPGAFLWYRVLPGQAWTTTPGVARLPVFHTTTIEYFARIGASQQSRIRRATYSYPGTASEQDSDGDGVPDFVEIAKGLDPNGGNDSDGDGFTDLSELFAGTNPASTNSVPAVGLNEGTSFDLLVAPRAVYEAANADLPARLGQGVGLHDLSGNLLARRITTNAPGVVVNPSALFRDAPADLTLELLSVATDSHFQVAGGVPTPDVGRELVGLLRVPRVEAATFGFVPGPGDLLGQADAWIAAAKAAIGSVPKKTIQTRLTHLDTLAAVLLERKVHQILMDRGHPGLTETHPVTLFPHRSLDILRTPLTAQDIASLRSPGPGNLPAWNLVTMHRVLSNAVVAASNGPSGRLMRDIYSISARSNNVAPGQYPLPMDVLRGFIVTGSLHSNYVAASGLTVAERNAARVELDQMLASLPPRPVAIHDLAITPGTFEGECRSLVTVPGGTIRSLFAAPGVPFKFPLSFDLVPGSLLRVRGFTDLDESCPGDAIEVLSAELISVPAVELVDLNGNLLPDAWECVFLGGGGDPYGDLDGDGHTNLQEYLDGTDPGDVLFKSLAPVDLSPPAIAIELAGGGGGHKLGWVFPAQYAGRFNFQLFEADELGLSFNPSGFGPVRLPGGLFEVNLPAPVEEKRFYIIGQRLR